MKLFLIFEYFVIEYVREVKGNVFFYIRNIVFNNNALMYKYNTIVTKQSYMYVA